MDKVFLLTDEQTKIIAGYGAMGDKVQLAGYRQMPVTAYERIRKLKAEGNTA